MKSAPADPSAPSKAPLAARPPTAPAQTTRRRGRRREPQKASGIAAAKEVAKDITYRCPAATN